MFTVPPRSPYDWNFHLFGISIRVHPLFWLGAALLGLNWLSVRVDFFLIWMVAVLVSIVVHELGHALAFRRYGVYSTIVLAFLVGLAVPTEPLAGRWRRVFVSLAGPGAGFLVAGALFFVDTKPLPLHLQVLVEVLFLINLYWGVINLLPVLPLDGGNVSYEVCTYFSPRHGLRIALEISLAVAGLVVVYSLMCEYGVLRDLIAQLPYWFPRGSLWTAILFGMLGVQSYQLLQSHAWTESHWDRQP